MRITIRRFSRLFSAAIVTLSLLPAGQASAVILNSNKDLPKCQRFLDYVGSLQLANVIYPLGVEQDRKSGLKKDCADRYVVHPISLLVLTPIDFPEDRQNPVKGSWIYRYSLTRCGDSKIYNAMIFADEAGGTPKAQAFYPGTSAAHPMLIYDAMPIAISTAMVQCGSTDIEDVEVFDLHLDKLPNDIGEGENLVKGAWNETWTFKVRGKQVEVPITFTPNSRKGKPLFMINTK
jgi:hypothetical protein